jgi:hypothetical protein
MDEKTLAYSDRAAAQLRETIGSMLVAFMESAKDVYAD